MIELLTISFNFMLGVLSSLSPCLFPLLPTFVAVTIKLNHSLKRSLISSLALVLGVLIVFFSLSFLTSAVIRVFLIQNYITFLRIQSFLLIIGGSFMLRTPSFLSKIHLPEKIDNLLYSDNPDQNPYLFSFGIGLVYTVIAAPCAGGYFVAVWGAMIGSSLLEQFIIVLSFSLGAGLPFLIIGAYTPYLKTEVLSNVRNASRKITIGLGILLILSGFWIFYTSF